MASEVAPSVLRVNVKDTASVDFAGQTVSSDEASEGKKFWGYETIGVWIDISAQSGTSPTLNIEFEWSEDSTNGIDGTWAPLQGYLGNSSVAAQYKVPEITTNTGAFSLEGVPVPASNDGFVRVNLNTGGTSPTYDVDSFYWVVRADEL